ncbi:MAG: heme exporter protein CcmB [Actinomycetes bacterium]|nr:heme exporter protein CcmB [Actinomycetes bacterium]
MKVSAFRQYRALLRKDIVMELRTKEMVTSMGLYAMLVLIIYYVALSQAGQAFDVTRIAAGLLLLVVVFTSMLGLNRSLVHEQDQGQLEALLLAPVDRPIIFFAKATTNLLFLAIVEVIIVPFFLIFFVSGAVVPTGSTVAVSQSGPAWMTALALLIGSIGIAGVGTLLATMSVNTKGRDFILAVLFIPVMFPLLLVIVSALSAVLTGDAGYAQTFWKMCAIGAGYDAIMIAVAFALYEFILGV